MKDGVTRKTYVIAVCAVLLISMTPGGAGAKDPHPGHGDHRPAWNKRCNALEDLDLSKDQLAAVNALNSRYKEMIMESYHAGMLQRIEISSLLRNSDADEKIILEKSGAYVKMRGQVFDLMMEYQIRIRAILTADQQRNWCTLMGAPDFHGGW